MEDMIGGKITPSAGRGEQQGPSVFPVPTWNFNNCFLTSAFPLLTFILSSSALSVQLHSTSYPNITSFTFTCRQRVVSEPWPVKIRVDLH